MQIPLSTSFGLGKDSQQGQHKTPSVEMTRSEAISPYAPQPDGLLMLEQCQAEPSVSSPSQDLELSKQPSSSSPLKGIHIHISNSAARSPKPTGQDFTPTSPSPLDQRLAVKIIRTNDLELIEVAYEEYKLLRSISHENIVKMHDAFYNQMKWTMYLVMDMVQGQSLTQMLEERQDKGGYDNEKMDANWKKPKVDKFNEEECKEIFIQLLNVIEYLSSDEVGVCHRDINPNNIMLDVLPEQESEVGVRRVEPVSGQSPELCTDFDANTKEPCSGGQGQPEVQHKTNEANQDYLKGDKILDEKQEAVDEGSKIKIESRSVQQKNRRFKLTLIDFNVAKRFVDQDTGNPLRMMTNTGTAKYQAPEMLGGMMSVYDYRVDLWSAGCVLYYLLTGGTHAFNFELQKDIEAAILEASFGTSLE